MSTINIDRDRVTEANATLRTTASDDQVYNLAVLVKHSSNGEASARAANLLVEGVQASSMRTALTQIVAAAKALISEHVARDQQIPWLEPPMEATESESRFLVPLHL